MRMPKKRKAKEKKIPRPKRDMVSARAGQNLKILNRNPLSLRRRPVGDARVLDGH